MINKKCTFINICLYYTDTIIFVLVNYMLCTFTKKNYEIRKQTSNNKNINEKFPVNSGYIILQKNLSYKFISIDEIISLNKHFIFRQLVIIYLR